MFTTTRIRVALCGLILGTIIGFGEARGQTYPPAGSAGWGSANPSGWGGYAPGAAWGVAPSPVTMTAPAPATASYGWSGYAPQQSWVGYAPQTAWTNYVPQRGWTTTPTGYIAPVARQPYRGYGTVNGQVTASYREFGTGRPVAQGKPWLPGAPR